MFINPAGSSWPSLALDGYSVAPYSVSEPPCLGSSGGSNERSTGPASTSTARSSSRRSKAGVGACKHVPLARTVQCRTLKRTAAVDAPELEPERAEVSKPAHCTVAVDS